MRKYIVADVTQEDIDAKRNYNLWESPVILALRRKTKRAVSLGPEMLYVNNEMYKHTKKSKELYDAEMKAVNSGKKFRMKPVKLTFTSYKTDARNR